MHIILEACSPSASVSGCMGVFKKKSMHLSLVCVLHLSAAAHFCSEEAKMLKSKQIFFFFHLRKHATKMLIVTVLQLYHSM